MTNRIIKIFIFFVDMGILLAGAIGLTYLFEHFFPEHKYISYLLMLLFGIWYGRKSKPTNSINPFTILLNRLF